MDLLAFTLHAEPLRCKFLSPEAGFNAFVHTIELLYLGAGAFLANIKFAASGLRRDLR